MKLNRISRTFNSETRNKFPMHLQIFADGGGTGADGGNSGVGDGDDGSGGGEDDGDKQPTVEELMAQLAEERKEYRIYRSGKLQKAIKSQNDSRGSRAAGQTRA